MALRAVASVIVAAASLVAPVAAYGVTPEKADQNITFSIPTSLRCAVRADGTVIAPSGWSMSNSGSGKVEITGVSVSNAIGKLRLSGKSGSVGYAVGEGSGSYAVSYDAAGGCRFSSTSDRPLGIESGKSLSWSWDIGKLDASDHRAALDAAASGRARLCDMSFSYAPVGNSLSSAGTTGSMSGAVDSHSSSVVPVGGTATANVGNAPSNASLSYQWYTVDSNGSYSAIANANEKTLKVLAAYRGKDIVCRVSDSSGHYSGYVETARKPVRNLAPKVGISGSAVYGSKLTAAASGLPSGATYTYKYRWQRLSGSSWADIANATAAEYTLGGEDVGKQVRVIVSTASNIYTVDDASAVSATVAKAKASIGVSISGTKNNSSRLTASVSGLPAAGANTVSYRWQRSSDGKSNWSDSTAGDAKSNSIQMQPNDVSWHYRCIVSASNSYYDIASAISAAYGPIAKSTVSAAKATISGNAVYGGTIKANVTNVPTVGTNSISYQWQYSNDGKAWNDTRLNGGNTSSLVLSAVSCVGTQYRCVVSVDSSYYIVPGCTTAGVKVGKASAQVVAKASGEAVAGKKLTAAVSGLPTVGGTNNVAYQWQYSEDGKTWRSSALTGANTSTLCLYDDSDVTHSMIGVSYRCVVSVNGNSAYDIKSATSNVIGPVVKGTAAAPSVSVGGTKKIESTLKATVTGLPKYGNNKVSYQWQTSADGSTWVDSTQSDAKSVSFKPAYSLVNQYVRCAVSVSNDQYSVATGYSAAYGKLGKASKTISAAITSPNKRNGDILTCGISGLASNGSNTISYKWEYATDSAFKTNVSAFNHGGNTHPTETGTGGYYRCTVTASNPYYEYNTAVSPVYGPLAKGVASAPTVTVSGSNAWGSMLKATVTGLPKYGTNKISYQWEARDDSSTTWGNSGYATATTDHITVDAQDAVSKSRHYRCKVTVDNDHYTVPVAYSADHGKTVKASATAKAAVSGTAAVGGKLTCSVSGLPTSGSNAVSYQWQQSSDNKTWTNSTYADAKTSAHSLGYKDAYNLYWRCSVTVSNPYYSVPTAYTDSRLCGKGAASITASVSGNAVIGGKLTCSVGGLPSIGTNSVKYRWQYSSDGKAWTDSENATASSNSITLPPDATLGKYFRCVVSATNPVYNDMSATSAASAKVGKGSHSAPSVSISGAKVYGSTLTASVSGQPTGTTSTAYQWQRADAANGTYANIASATGKTYSVGTADMNKYLRVLVNTANTYYNVPQGVSSGYGAIGKATSSPSVKLGGTALTGGTLTCTVSGLPAVGTNNIAYQWQYSKDGSTDWTNSSYSDAKTNSLKLQGADIGWHYRCSVSFSGNAYYDIKGAVTAASAAIGKGTSSAPKVTISGGKSYGSSMTASVSGQPSGTTSTSYQWQYSSDGGKTWTNSTWSGSTTSKIPAFGGDFEGKYFRCVVTTASSQWNVPVAYSAAFGPLVKGSASISATLGGSAVVGGKLTASVGGLPTSGTNTVSYQWQSSKDGKSWTNSTTGNTKALSTGDLGLHYRCHVSATNPYYTIASGYTAASAATGKGTVNASVHVSGTKSVGSKLTANVSGLPGTGTNTVAYKWQWSKDGSTGWTDSGYTDAKASSIVMHAEDIGYYYRCVITVSGNAYYNVNGATSAAYGPMGKGSYAAPTVSISGTKAYGSTLTANVSSQPGGTTGTTYQWQRNSGSNGAWVNISNATEKTYVLTGSDLNHSLRVLVNTSNTYYNVPQGASAAYGTIGKAGKTISASVSGTKSNTSKLTVSVSGLPTVGTNTVSYQWQWSKDGSTGWTNSTYSDGKSNAIQMKEADVGYYYRCVVSVSGNAYYNVTGATTSAYGPMAKSSHGAPTVSVSGSKTYGSTLTANVSGQPSGTTATSYQWQRASSATGTWSNIANATGKTYKLGTGDMNQYLRVLVGTTSTYYTVSQGVSAGYGPIGKATASISATVSGSKVIESAITANVTGLPSVGTNTVSYQWQYSSDNKTWTNSAQTDAKTKTITPNHTWAGIYARCVISVSGNAYYNINGYTLNVGQIAKGTKTASVSLTGNAVVGGSLKANVSGLPANGTNTVAYQWQYSSDNKTWTTSTAGDAKTATHALNYKEAYNLYWRCTVSVSGNQYYNVHGATSASKLCGKGTASITASVSGSTVIGGKLTCSVGGLPSIGTNSVAYKWQYSADGSTWADSNNSGAKTNSISLPPDGTLGKRFRCVVTATNAVYNNMSATSAATAAVGKGTATASVSVNGSKVYGATLTANPSQPTGTTGTSYQWQRNTGTNGAWVNISNATGKTYVAGTADVGHSVRVLVNTTNTYYNVSQCASAAAAIGKATATATATVSGTKAVGSKLTVSVGGLPSVGTNTIAYKWQYSSDNKTWTDSASTGAKSNVLTTDTTWLNKYARCIITVSGNAYYNVNGATSAGYGPIGKGSHAAPTVSVSGSKTYGSTLTATINGLPSGTTGITYQWQRADSADGAYINLTYATNKTYVVSQYDINNYMRVLVSMDNSFYVIPSAVVSAAYGPIGKASHSAPSVSVSGDKSVGSTLTASVSGQPTGTTSTTYQWQRASSASGSYSNISGATGKTYKTVSADANKYVRVLVNTANTYYTVSQGVSAGYGQIALGAFAVYSADDNSLDFYKRSTFPVVGKTFNGKIATAVYTGIEKDTYDSNNIPWKNYLISIKTSTVVDSGIAPVSTGFWFAHCSNLTSINFSNLNVSNVTNISYMFSDCSSLSSINLSSWNVVNVTNMCRVFQSCSSLSSINLSSWNVGNVTDMNGMFFDCSSLTSVGNLSSWNTSNVIDMSSMFYNCLSLTTLDVSNFDTSNVTDMAFMFAGNGVPTDSYMKLKNIIGLSGWNTSKVTSMSNMFQNCSSLTSVGNLSNWKTGNVTSMKCMFINCPSIASVGNLAGWNTSKVITMNRMFFNCSSLASVGDFSNWNTSKVTNMYGMFYNCLSLTTLDVSNFDTSNVTDMAFMFAGSGSSTSYMKLKNIGNLSGWNTSKVTSMASMFQKCSSLTSVGNLSNWKTGNVTSMDGMFDYCSSLTSVGDLSNWNTGNVTSMRRMFIKCSSLASVGNLAGWNTSKVTTMNRMFFNCASLVSVNLYNWNTSKVTDMYCMFYKCYRITSVGDLSKWNVSKVTTMNGMLGNCQVLTSVGNLSGWNTSNVTDMNYMFQSCFKLIVDCSKWNVSKVTGYKEFNYKASGVIAPKWVSSDEVTDEDSIITLNNESEIENKTIENTESVENTEQESSNNKISDGAEVKNKSIENIKQEDDNNKNITTELNNKNVKESQIINNTSIEQNNQTNDTIN